MGRRGPRPTPLKLHVLKGTWDHRLMMPEPAADDGPCPPPADLDAEAREVWLRLQPELEAKGLLAPRYSDLFRVLCETVVVNRRTGYLLMTSGPLLREKSGDGERPVVNPAWRAYRQSAELLKSLCAEYGLTPSAVSDIARTAGVGARLEAAENAGRDPRRILSS